MVGRVGIRDKWLCGCIRNAVLTGCDKSNKLPPVGCAERGAI